MREPGYYWINLCGIWMPAQFSTYGFWEIIGCGPVRESEILEVGERLVH